VKYVGIAAHSKDVSEDLKAKASVFLRELRSKCPNDVALVVGGYWGLMKFVVDEGLSLGFNVVVLPPIEQEDVEFPEKVFVIKTGTSYRVRSVFLARTSDALVVLGGGAGCMQELVTAYTEGKPIFALVGTGMPTDVVVNLPEYLDDRHLAPIKKYLNPVELTSELCRTISERKGRKPLVKHG